VKRPENLLTKTIEKRTGCGSLFITVSLPGQGYNEVYGLLGKTGGCASCMISAITRSITVGWNAGADLNKIIKQLDGSKCPHMTMVAKSCPQAIADVLRDTQLRREPID
jgi:hypothetical protein